MTFSPDPLMEKRSIKNPPSTNNILCARKISLVYNENQMKEAVNKKMAIKINLSTPLRINIWGILLIVFSLYGMILLLSSGHDHYRYLHQEYPPAIIALRYCVSWAVKILGFISGVGILYRKDFFRKTAIAGSLFTILTIHLKHSYAGFSQHARYLDDHLDINLQGIAFSSLAWPAMMTARVLDIIFAVLLIYFFTRPEVRKYFGR